MSQAEPLNIEVLIFDGGSNDGTRSLIKKYEQCYPNLRYIRALKKGGIDADMAKAVELVGSEYCWLFSGDDILRKDSLTVVLDAVKNWNPDLLLCRHNECHFDMSILKDWPVLSIKKDRLFDLGEPQDRLEYLESALTSEAFFSFMGGLVVKRQIWFKGKLEPSFTGSNWAHIGRLWSLTDSPFKVGYIHEVLLDRRGGNDSFSSGGMLSRLDIQINGLLGIIGAVFGDESLEMKNLKRVVRGEVEPHWANAVRADLTSSNADESEFLKLDQMLDRIKA